MGAFQYANIFSWNHLTPIILKALAPALLINVYITGLNQIYDVEIDRQNKPYLPIPAGRLGMRAAAVTVSVALGVAAIMPWLVPHGRRELCLALYASAALGTVYSM